MCVLCSTCNIVLVLPYNSVTLFTLKALWAQEHCRISRPCFLAMFCKKRLNQASFVLLCFVLFAFSGLCLVFVVSFFVCPLFSSIYRHEWPYCADVPLLLTHPHSHESVNSLHFSILCCK